MNHCLVFGARGHLAQTRIIPALENLSWFNPDRQRDWFSWYVNEYLCSDMESVARRIDQLL